MADNKNQHFVPRVHLRPFSVDGAGQAIHLFNFDRGTAISNAAVKHQCSGDYFYGDNRLLERAINGIENPYGEVVRHLVRKDAAINAATDIVLKRFVLLQYMRTDAASRRASEMMLALQEVPGSDLPVPTIREAVRGAVQAAMHQYREMMSIVDDLRLCIVRNRTDVRFVTSDDPAVLTNRLFIQRRGRIRRSFGAKHAGALFLLPLTPRLCAILYDGAVYSIAHRARWVDIDRPSDAEAINDHQFLGCWANVYFGEWAARESVAAAAEASRSRRSNQRHSVTQAVLTETTDWGERYEVRPATDLRAGEKVLVHVRTIHPEPSAWPAFLRFRAGATAYSNNSSAGLVRRWCLDQGFVTGGGYRKVRV